jgi:hypothetical protein
MSEVGNEIQQEDYSNFEFLNTINLKQSQLNIKVEVGILNIPSRAGFAAAYAENFAENQFYPTPGGKQGQSFINNTILNSNKSQTLTSTVNGVANQHFEITGAPYCTFVEGTLEAGAVHPYYNLIKGPANAPFYEYSSTLQYAQNNPAILNQFFQQSYSAESLVFNKVGAPFIPGTSKTSNAVQQKLTDGKIKSLTSYNIWEVENLGGIDFRDPKQKENKTQYFSFQQYLGFLPKPGATLDKVQPYAQTVSFSDTAEIQVFASNSQVSLRRYYPIAKDYAHDKESKYLIYDSATGSPELKDELLKLDQETYVPDPKRPNNKKTVPAVGFVLKFSSVVLNNIPPTAAEGQPTVLATPQILVSWGKINASIDELNNADASGNILKYTLKFTANATPVVYFNITDAELTNDVVSANAKSVQLTNLKGINVQDGNTGSKTPNNFQIFVYYSGPYMQIGNTTNPGEWQTVAAPSFEVQNYPGGVTQPEKKLKHMLDENSEIRIQAQFINFTFAYGPPLFSPYDPNNISKFSSNIPNTLNYVSGALPAPLETLKTEPTVFNGFAVSASAEQTVPEIILNNAIRTFQSAEDFDLNVAEGEQANNTEINSPIFLDARASITANDFQYSTVANGTKFKLTFPKNAGGLTFNNFTPTIAPEPNIKESYTFYDLKLQNTSDTVSEILSNSVTSMTVSKNIDGESNSRIQSNLNLTLVNLNKSENGLKILQFMRQNIVTIRVSAGYETIHPFFEGMIENIKVTEGLSETKITIEAKDLLQKLFIEDETMIVSQVYMKFNGLRYNKAINQLVYFSELHNHFKYALGDPLDKENQTLAYAFNFNPLYRLPRVDVSMVNPQLASLSVGAFDDKTNTYYSVLKYIKNLSIQTNTKAGEKNVRFDVPIYYWYTSGSGEDQTFQGTQEVVRGNGIVMSSRTLEKDRDIFYLSKKNISNEMTKNISSLHGMLFNNDAFESSSSSINLFSEGQYRFINGQGKFIRIVVKNEKQNQASIKLPFIEDVESYVGYEKIVFFDKAPQEFLESQNPSSLLPKDENARFWTRRIFNSSFTDVYETITLKAFVTKPLKEWGCFFVAFEEEDGTLVRMPDRYLYQGVSYNFDIDKNIITAKIDASRKPIQALE